MSQHDGSKDPDRGSPRHALRVIRVQPGEHLTVRTVSTEYVGLLTHWVRGRSMLCEGPECSSVMHRSGAYWKGYALVQQWFQPRTMWYTAVLEISEHCELDFRGRWKRGQIWSVERDPQTGRSRTAVRARLESEVAFGGLPQSFDFIPVLLTLYHVGSIVHWSKNPMPGRILVEPTAGDPPFADKQSMDPGLAAEAWKELRRRFKLGVSTEDENAVNSAKLGPPVLNGKKVTGNEGGPPGHVI